VVLTSAIWIAGVTSRILVYVSAEIGRGLAELLARYWDPTRRRAVSR